MLDISKLRHPNETTLSMIAMIFGGIFWLALLVATVGGILVLFLYAAILLFILNGLFRAIVYGDTLRVSERQFPHLHQMVAKCAVDLGLKSTPETFVVSSGGALNALAVRFLSKRYVLLYSHLIDVLDEKQLRMIVAHEIAHHAAGHLNFWRNLLTKPVYLVPLLGPAYSRSCEYTADRIAAAYVNDLGTSSSALAALACGSGKLIPRLDSAAYQAQEEMVPRFFGLLMMLFATHPRTTRRVIEIERFLSAPVPQLAAPAPVQAG